MPKLLPQTREIRKQRFVKALARTGSPAKAALETFNIGSRGAKDIANSAASQGSQYLKSISLPMVEALAKKGVNEDRIADRTNDLLESQDPLFIDKGISQAMKMGVGGGYAAEKTQNLNVNVNATPDELQKYKTLREEYEQKLLKEIAE